MKMKIGIISFVALVLSFCVNFLLIIGDSMEGIPIQQHFLSVTFDMKTILERKSFVLTMENMVGVVIFSIFFGMVLYQEFLGTGVYILLRVENRTEWFRKKMKQLLIKALLFSFSYFAGTLVLCCLKVRSGPNWEVLELFVLMSFAYTILMYQMITIINYVAVRTQIAVGYFTGYLVLIILVHLCLKFEQIPVLGDYYWLSFMNPVNALSLYLIDSVVAKLIILLYYCGLCVLETEYVVRNLAKTDVSLGMEEV